ncbi:MAG: hypothetical protein IRY91_15385, partial [Gemmatimonadaceae bacterium]|nr:hypothetical protein [Gemmatimonadaceae bacterium]
FDTTVVPLGSGDWAGIGWGGHTAGSRPFRLPVVQSAVWRGADGSVGVVIANADSVAHTVPLSLDCAAWTCPAGPLRIAVRRVGAEARVREESRRTVTEPVALAPFDAVVVEIRSARATGAADRR